MASPVADTYSVASGVSAFAGRYPSGLLYGGASLGALAAVGGMEPRVSSISGDASVNSIGASGGLRGLYLPDWVPEPGTFADVALGTLYDARPTGWPTAEAAGPFINWCGAVWAPEFGEAGGFVIHGSGHLSPGTPLWAGVWIWDVATRVWVGRNIPPGPMLESGDFATDFNTYYERITGVAAGHPYPAHTYDGLVYQSPADGGSSVGNLLRVCIGGGGFSGNKCVHSFDLSSPTAAPTRVIDSLSHIASSYPATDRDVARGGFWSISYIGMGGIGFTRFSDMSTTVYTTVHGDGKSDQFNGQSNQNLIYVPGHDCLVATGGSVSRETRVCPIVDGVPQGWTLITPTGTPPADLRCGGVWSTLLGKIVSYEDRQSSTVHMLNVPDDLVGGTWSWESETLTGVGGATPSGYPSGTGNGAWGRFVEAPDLRCFLWCGGVNDSVQAFRLTGM